MGKKKIPDRWLDYKAIGSVISETPFVAFKVPLHQRICDNLPDDNKHTTKDVIKAFPELAMVIDLTNSPNRTKYYDPFDWKSRGIVYEKIQCKGHVTPPQNILVHFCNIVRNFLIQNPTKLIGVHCTHGLNRTGYFVCSFMVLVQQMPPHIALKKFADARGYEIERKNYVSSIIAHHKNLELKNLLNQESLKLKQKEETGRKRKLQDYYDDHDRSQDLKNKLMSKTENEEQQERLRNCMDISGLPSNIFDSSNLKEIASGVLNDHKIPHDTENILNVEKTEISENKFILVVTFKSYEEKMRIMKLKRDFHKNKKFKIYFNHTLTSTNRVLFMQAKHLSSRFNLRVNITHGQIFISKSNGTQAVQIKSIEDLERIEQNGGLFNEAGPSSSKRRF